MVREIPVESSGGKKRMLLLHYPSSKRSETGTSTINGALLSYVGAKRRLYKPHPSFIAKPVIVRALDLSFGDGNGFFWGVCPTALFPLPMSLLNPDKIPSGSYARRLAIILESVVVSLY